MERVNQMRGNVPDLTSINKVQYQLAKDDVEYYVSR